MANVTVKALHATLHHEAQVSLPRNTLLIPESLNTPTIATAIHEKFQYLTNPVITVVDPTHNAKTMGELAETGGHLQVVPTDTLDFSLYRNATTESQRLDILEGFFKETEVRLSLQTQKTKDLHARLEVLETRKLLYFRILANLALNKAQMTMGFHMARSTFLTSEILTPDTRQYFAKEINRQPQDLSLKQTFVSASHVVRITDLALAIIEMKDGDGREAYSELFEYLLGYDVTVGIHDLGILRDI